MANKRLALSSGLPLNISLSPLMSQTLFDDLVLDTVLPRLSVPLPSITISSSSGRHHARHRFEDSLSPSSSTSTSKSRVIQSIPTEVMSGFSTNCEKPLPSIPVPAKDVISLLDLLEKLDADMSIEVHRVKEGISDLRDLITVRREERDKASKEARRRTLAIENDPETKLVDSDFWLNV